NRVILCLFLILMINHSGRLYAQNKIEKESRLKREEVVTKAVEYIDSLAEGEKVKWYLEEGIDNKSIEAKFELDKQKFSVEFDSIGNLEDIEIQLKWKDLSKPLQDTIQVYLGEVCKKFRIKKIQIQYSGNPTILLSKIQTDTIISGYQVKYEIVARCKNKDNVALYEYLFSETGQTLSVTQIVFKSSTNLEY